MSTNRGIFESFPSQDAIRTDSPFAVVAESNGDQASAPASPFAAAARHDSPFMVVDDAPESIPSEFSRPVRLPERRKADSPFQIAEVSEGFGFEAPARALAASPFESAPATPVPNAPAPQPFSSPPQLAPSSPFSAEPNRTVSAPTQAAIAAFTNWQEPPVAPAAAAAPQPFAPVTPTAFAEPAAPVFAPPVFAEPVRPAVAPPAQQPEAVAPAPPAPVVAPPPAQVAATPAPTDESQSDSFNIRQLELRAIFGVDREMNADEIMQRSRALPGMRNIARISPSDITTIDALKHLLPGLGFGSGALKIYCGSVPLEFIREGPVMLAVQTDGGFAPGVRETLMIVARELNRIG
jgi:hypothetical protein